MKRGLWPRATIGPMSSRAAQNYANHVFRPVLSGTAGLFVIVAAIAFTLRWFLIGGRVTMAIGIAALMASECVLIAISRVYTTRLQDRIIRLEMRVRAATLLTPERQRALEGLGLKHVAALRFASDAELPALLDRAVREKLTPDDIKRGVTAWVPDHDRT